MTVNDNDQVVFDELGGDDPRPGYVQPCGCVWFPAWTAYYNGNAGTHYQGYTDNYNCQCNHNQ